jgi:cephalosporin hydroxylase
MTLREWVEQYQEITVTNICVAGVLAWKSVFDLSVIKEIIHETQP